MLKDVAAQLGRIIPAHAGSTDAATAKAARRRDHPRSRGEHPDHMLVYLVHCRIIPAHAGSTLRAPGGGI